MESKVGEHNISGCNGNCREIFLFSNGEHDSPPRKYHLRPSEQWDATLIRLANSQYGSNHIIELYTVDGKKIEGPLELTNGTAYVAVEPPAAFEPAGYHDYLMKATRSREKRQEKISVGDLLPKPVKMNSKDKIEEEYEHNESTNIIQDVVLLPTIVTAAEDHNSITDKIKSNTPRNIKPFKRTSTLKQTENKNGALPQRSPPIMIQNTNQVTPEVKLDKSSRVRAIKKKFETPCLKSTKYTRTPTKPNTIVTNTTRSKFKGDEAVNVQQASNIQENTKPNDLTKELDIISLPNEKTAELKASHDLNIDSLLPVLVNYEKDQGAPEHFNPLKNPATADAFSKDEEYHHGIIDGSPSSKNQHAGSPERVCDTENKQTILKNTLNELSQTITILIGSQTGDKSFSIYLKQGSIVNLKLNVAVQNESNIVVEKNQNNQVNTMKSGVNTSKSDVAAQENNTVVAKNCREASVLTEIELSFEQICQISNASKVAICKYNCCSCSANPESSVLAHLNNNSTFISLPLGKQNEHFISCTCKNNEINQNNKCEIQENQMLPGTNRNTVQSDEIKDELPGHNNDLMHNPMPNEEHLLPKKVSIVEGNHTSNCCETSTAQNQSIQLCELPSGVPNQTAPVTEFTNFRDASTQTDWSGIVLEARPRADGTYEFHLPSLETIKLCNALY